MKTILLVEDQYPVIPRDILVGMGGFEIEVARSGDKAMALLLQNNYDLVLLDLRLPGLSGLEILEALRIADPDLPVVVLSGWTDKKVRERCAALGAAAFFQKPANFRQLHRRIIELMAHRDAQRLRARETIRLDSGQAEELARRRRLMKLKEQKAAMGLSTPPEVLTEIEDIEGSL